MECDLVAGSDTSAPRLAASRQLHTPPLLIDNTAMPEINQQSNSLQRGENLIVKYKRKDATHSSLEKRQKKLKFDTHEHKSKETDEDYNTDLDEEDEDENYDSDHYESHSSSPPSDAILTQREKQMLEKEWNITQQQQKRVSLSAHYKQLIGNKTLCLSLLRLTQSQINELRTNLKVRKPNLLTKSQKLLKKKAPRFRQKLPAKLEDGIKVVGNATIATVCADTLSSQCREEQKHYSADTSIPDHTAHYEDAMFNMGFVSPGSNSTVEQTPPKAHSPSGVSSILKISPDLSTMPENESLSNAPLDRSTSAIAAVAAAAAIKDMDNKDTTASPFNYRNASIASELEGIDPESGPPPVLLPMHPFRRDQGEEELPPVLQQETITGISSSLSHPTSCPSLYHPLSRHSTSPTHSSLHNTSVNSPFVLHSSSPPLSPSPTPSSNPLSPPSCGPASPPVLVDSIKKDSIFVPADSPLEAPKQIPLALDDSALYVPVAEEKARRERLREITMPKRKRSRDGQRKCITQMSVGRDWPPQRKQLSSDLSTSHDSPSNPNSDTQLSPIPDAPLSPNPDTPSSPIHNFPFSFGNASSSHRSSYSIDWPGTPPIPYADFPDQDKPLSLSLKQRQSQCVEEPVSTMLSNYPPPARVPTSIRDVPSCQSNYNHCDSIQSDYMYSNSQHHSTPPTLSLYFGGSPHLGREHTAEKQQQQQSHSDCSSDDHSVQRSHSHNPGCHHDWQCADSYHPPQPQPPPQHQEWQSCSSSSGRMFQPQHPPPHRDRVGEQWQHHKERDGHCSDPRDMPDKQAR